MLKTAVHNSAGSIRDTRYTYFAGNPERKNKDSPGTLIPRSICYVAAGN